MAQPLTNPTTIHEDGVDLALLWLWLWLAAVAPIRPLAWEPPYASSAALKSKKKEKKRNDNRLILFQLYSEQVGVPIGAQQNRIQLGAMRLWV